LVLVCATAAVTTAATAAVAAAATVSNYAASVTGVLVLQPLNNSKHCICHRLLRRTSASPHLMIVSAAVVHSVYSVVNVRPNSCNCYTMSLKTTYSACYRIVVYSQAVRCATVASRKTATTTAVASLAYTS
jgi:hypothetical protein